MALSLALGRLRHSAMVLATESADFTVGTQGSTIEVAVDGEILRLEAPLRFEIQVGALKLLTAPPGPQPG